MLLQYTMNFTPSHFLEMVIYFIFHMSMQDFDLVCCIVPLKINFIAPWTDSESS